MEKYNCYTLVFSSSCTVYGEPESLPITEEKETGRRVTNVYGKTKYFIEEMLKDVSHSNEVIIKLPSTMFGKAYTFSIVVTEMEYNRIEIF